MPTIEELRASMKAAVLTGSGNYLPVGLHQLEITKFFFKSPGTNSPMGIFFAEMKLETTSNPEAAKVGMTYSEGFDPAKVGWMERMKKFLLAGLGLDYRGEIPEAAHDLVADIRFSCEFASEAAKLAAKYGRAPETFLVGRKIIGEGTPYTTKPKGTMPGKLITSMKWSPIPVAAQAQPTAAA